ncbi:DUF5060 domain-containing protein [Paraflavisolibacter sp. H34]|uniref:DUF5060 domain-containing protein n=1 Tax=Huijunlia imazamoxiresistens TaxID=3127457 RepID=UPI0030186FE3
MRTTFLFFSFFLFISLHVHAQQQVEKWGVFELSLKGSDAGNPFIGTTLTATFTRGGKTYRPEGFYDGNGTYKVRFMPDAEGEWSYTTSSNQEALNNKKGTFTCVAPAKGNHGPVSVRNTYNFAYADSTAYIPFGTTIYEWSFQGKDRKAQTIQTLKGAPFNKARMLLVPPYKKNYLEGPDKIEVFPFVGTSRENWDFSRFRPEYFQQLEKDVEALRDLGIQADLILLRPYDGGKWGFDRMDDETNIRFLRYAVARFGAYHNIWWSLCNENSFIKHLSDEDWDRYFQVVQQYDPYGHLRSIHNADRLYDYKKPWVTHVSLQYYNAVREFGVSPLLRDIYRKPVVHDEINYEGNIERRWGQLSGEELTHRFWIAYVGGAYATHGEATNDGWISGGGKLTGTSPQRIAFLRQVVESAPSLRPIDQYYILNAAGKYGEYYLYYLGKETPKEWKFVLPDDELKDGMRFKVEVIDTWNMTITPAKQLFEVKKLNNYQFVEKNGAKVKLPGKPYLALRITKVEDAHTQPNEKKVKRNELTDEEQ